MQSCNARELKCYSVFFFTLFLYNYLIFVITQNRSLFFLDPLAPRATTRITRFARIKKYVKRNIMRNNYYWAACGKAQISSE